MAPRKAPATKKIQTEKKGVLKHSQRFIHSKAGKLSKTNLVDLFQDQDVWNTLSKEQQLDLLEDLKIRDLFGEGHPMETVSGKYINYFTTLNPLATRVSPDRSTGIDTVQEAKESYFDLTKHLDKFRNHLVAGQFVPQWIATSQEFSTQRARGDYDDHWQHDPDTALSDESKLKVAAVKAKRLERIQKGLE